MYNSGRHQWPDFLAVVFLVQCSCNWYEKVSPALKDFSYVVCSSNTVSTGWFRYLHFSSARFVVKKIETTAKNHKSSFLQLVNFPRKFCVDKYILIYFNKIDFSKVHLRGNCYNHLQKMGSLRTSCFFIFSYPQSVEDNYLKKFRSACRENVLIVSK